MNRKIIYGLFLLILVDSLIFGIGLPFLMSYPDTLLVIVGFVIGIITIVFNIEIVIKIIMKILK